MSNRFLDIYGVEHYHNLIKTEAVAATQTEATNVWTGELDATALAPGKSILYTMPDGSTAGAATLNLTLSDGTTTGAKAVKTLTGENVASAYTAGILHMVYDGTNWTILHGPERAFKTNQTLTAGNVTSATFAPTGYSYENGDENLIEVYMNGLKMTGAEYTAAQSGTGITVTFASAITAGTGDTIEMVLRK